MSTPDGREWVDQARMRQEVTAGVTLSGLHLRDLDVLASGALGTLSPLERDGLPFTEIVETSFATCRAVEEVLVPVTGQDETKPFVTDEPFDRAVHGRHGDLLESISS